MDDTFSIWTDSRADKRNGTPVDILYGVLEKYNGLTSKDLYLEQFKIIGDIYYGTC